MKTWMRFAVVVAANVAVVTSSFASLLNVGVTYPDINYLNNSVFALSYTPTNQLLSINTTPTTLVLAPLQTPTVFTGVKSLKINIAVDNTGTLVGSAPGDGGQDLVLSGTVTVGTNTYSGVLLTGQVFGFGWLPGLSSQYDFRFTPNGGPLASLFCGNISVTMDSEASTFTGDFTTNFNGRTKGICGSEDTTPPTIVCPSNITAQCHYTNGLAGAYVSYPTPVVTDNCDPNPSVVCTPPSGSFFALPPPPANSTNYVVTCVATDASGNTNVCSFIITVEDTMPPQFADTNNPVVQCGAGGGQIILTNDAGECYATFAFPIPTATDCCGGIDTVSVSAVDENGANIVLTNLGNGMLQGEFPVDVTGTNLITVTANDGRGNSAQCQTPVLVLDKQPPTLFCSDQTVTFKPILTNALSCIQANFNNVCIVSNNYIWFSSVMQNPSCYNRGSFTVHVFNQTIQLAVDNTNVTLNVPDAYVTFSNGVAATTTTFTNGQWITITKPGLSGNTFLSGLAWQIPFSLNNNINNRNGRCWGKDSPNPWGSRCQVNSATWCGRFAVDTPGVTIQWQWGAVVETTLNTNCNVLGVKPCDDNRSSCWKNSDPAGACENFKSRLTAGACGNGTCGWGFNQQPDCTGILSACARANLGVGEVCLGAVEFTPPLAVDNCGGSLTVVCTPPPGSILGPGVYPVTTVATDASGNTSQCTFNLTVLAPLQVVFDTPCDDNLADNTSDPDVGFSDMNCPDDPSTTELITPFKVGSLVCHAVRLLDCNGNDVTSQQGPYCTVHIDITERQGTYCSSVLVNAEPANYNCVGSPGGIMVPNCNGEFQYNLNTCGYPAHTLNSNLFFRSCVWVEYNSSPGVPVGMEDVILESQ